MPRIRRLPQHNDRNGWWGLLTDVQPARQLVGTLRVKTAIIGGGICGVSAANRLAELCPEDEICLIEATRIGFGASGRNAGFMLNMHSHGVPKNLDVLRRSMKFWDAGLTSLRNKVNNWQIQCDWVESGRFYGAAGPDGEKHLSELEETLHALGLDFKLQDRSSLKQRIGTEFYIHGMYVPGSTLVNPAAMMRGLARNLPSNVAVFEQSPVTAFEIEGDGYRIMTEGGTVIADRLVLASGVFLKDFGIATGHYVPMATYASLTEPLGPEALSFLGTSEEFGLLASSEIGSTIRLTRDRRLFVRNSYNFEPGAPANRRRALDIAETHRNAMIARWPDLAKVTFDYTWGGAIAFTTNNGAVFGAYGKNLYAVLTNDVGPMTRGEAAGALLADYMEGRDSDLLRLQLSMPAPKRLPPRPFLDLGIKLRGSLQKLRTKQEL